MSGRYRVELGDYLKSDRELAFELKEHIELACPWQMTFNFDLPQEYRAAAEKHAAHHFQMWAEAWLWPIAMQLAYRAGIPAEEFRQRETYAQARANGKRQPDWA